MIGIMEIKAGYEGAKAALDIAKGVSSLKTETAVNAAIIDIQRHVVEAQQGLSTSLQKIDELEKEIVRLKDWSAEKERYELKDTGSGAVAYALKQSVAGGQPAHYLCADCFENGHKAYLQPEERVPGRDQFLVCNQCRADLLVRGSRRPEHSKRGR
jgi:hypothetical protein